MQRSRFLAGMSAISTLQPQTVWPGQQVLCKVLGLVAAVCLHAASSQACSSVDGMLLTDVVALLVVVLLLTA